MWEGDGGRGIRKAPAGMNCNIAKSGNSTATLRSLIGCDDSGRILLFSDSSEISEQLPFEGLPWLATKLEPRKQDTYSSVMWEGERRS